MNTEQSQVKPFLSVAIGTMIEYYDYALFSLFLPILAPLFFPSDSGYESLMKGYSVFLIAIVMKPLGGLVFGCIGDTLGRRVALLISMYGIAIATLALGLIPSYAVWGNWAIVAIVLAKSIQIFCFGGEFNGAGIYVTELAKNKNEIFLSCLLTAMTLLGSLFASFWGVLVTYPFMPDWSWRLAFLCGGIIGIMGILPRKNLVESSAFKQVDLQSQRLISLLQSYPKELIAGVFVGGFATVPFVTVLTFINPVLASEGYFSNHALMLTQTFLIAWAVFVLVGVGLFAKYISPLKLMLITACALTLFSYPLLLLIDSKNLLLIVSALMVLIALNEIFLGPVHVFFKNCFKMQYRYRASSISFGLGMSLFGGVTPLIEGYLYKFGGHFIYLSFWLILVGLGTAFCLLSVYKKQSLVLGRLKEASIDNFVKSL